MSQTEDASSAFDIGDSCVQPGLYKGNVMMRRMLMTVGALLCVGLAVAEAHEIGSRRLYSLSDFGLNRLLRMW
jgi:hypothetical protein